MQFNWDQYPIENNFDETISSPSHARAPSRKLLTFLNGLTDDDIKDRLEARDTAIKTIAFRLLSIVILEILIVNGL